MHAPKRERIWGAVPGYTQMENGHRYRDDRYENFQRITHTRRGVRFDLALLVLVVPAPCTRMHRD